MADRLKFLVGLSLLGVSSGNTPPWGNVSGFANTIDYFFQNSADTNHFVTLLEPLASYVRDQEQAITWSFRPFVSADGLNVKIVSRFIDKAAYDGPHVTSTKYVEFTANVAAWNASTHAITNKVQTGWDETSTADGEALGAWHRKSPSSVEVAGFAHSVQYTLKDSAARDDFILILRPWANGVRDNQEQTTFTFRPFLSTTGEPSVFLLERFPTKADYEGPNFNDNETFHSVFINFFSVWQHGTHGVTSTVHEDWQELAMGVFSREAEQLVMTGSVLV